MSRIIKDCRGGKNDFRCKSWFKLHDIIMCKKESVTIKINKNNKSILKLKNITATFCFKLQN